MLICQPLKLKKPEMMMMMLDFKQDRTKNTINYKTTSATYVLNDKSLSIKAKGLYCLILQLKDATIAGYEFSLNNIKDLNKDGIDSTRAALNELRKHGYVVRTKIREQGKITGYAYTILEAPVDNEPQNDQNVEPKIEPQNDQHIEPKIEPQNDQHIEPKIDACGSLNTSNVDNSNIGANFPPTSGNPTTFNSLNYKSTNNINNINNLSINQSELQEQEKANSELEYVMDMIGLNELKLSERFDPNIVANFESVIQDMYTSTYTKIGKDVKPRSILQSRIKKLNFECLEWTILQFLNVNTKIYNITSYIKAMIYNAVGSYKIEPHNDIKATFGY